MIFQANERKLFVHGRICCLLCQRRTRRSRLEGYVDPQTVTHASIEDEGINKGIVECT